MEPDQLLLHPAASSEHERAFEEFHAANPEVHRRLVELVTTWVHRRGMHRLGMKMLFEVLRWEVGTGQLHTVGDDFHLNNNHTAFYVRLVERDHPEWIGLFEKRRSQADAMDAAA